MKTLNKLLSLLLAVGIILSSIYTTSYALAASYENDFDTATVTDSKIYDGETEMFANVELLGDSTNKYIKGTSSNAFFFRARKVFYTGYGILEFDVNLAQSGENFVVLIAGSSKNHTVLTFTRSTGLTDDEGVMLLAANEVSAGWHRVKIMLNYDTPRKYSIIFDNKLVVDNYDLDTAPDSRGIKITTVSGIDNLKYYVPTLPQPYGADFEIAPKVGSVAAGKVLSHSLADLSTAMAETKFSYYLSDTVDGTYTEITSTDTTDDLYITANGGLAILGDYEGKFIKLGAKIYSATDETSTVYSEPKEIAACDTLNLTSGTASKDVCFKLPGSSSDITWSLSPASVSGLSLTSDGILTVSSVPGDNVYVKSTHNNTGSFTLKKLNFLANSSDGTDLSAEVYPVIFDTQIDTSEITSLNAGGINFIIDNGRINGTNVNDSFNFKLVFDNNKYYAFADGKIISTGDNNQKPLKLTADGNFASYYAGSPLVSDGVFIKCEIPSVIGEGTSINADYEFYNESGIYPADYSIEWYLDDIKVSNDDTYTVPYGKIGSEVYAKVIADRAVSQTNTSTIDSQYDLTIVSDGTYDVDLKSADRNAYVLFVGDDNSVYMADMTSSEITVSLTPGQGYTMYFVNKSDLALRGMPVSINGNSYSDIILTYINPHINYLTRKGMGVETNTAVLFKAPYSESELISSVFPSVGAGDLSDIIRDVYVTDNSSASYTNMESIPGGIYNLISVDGAGVAIETELCNKDYELFTDITHYDYTDFYKLTADVLAISDESALEICTVLNGITDKSMIPALVGTSAGYFPAAVRFISLKEMQNPTDASFASLKSELDAAGLKSDFTELLKSADSYELIMSSVDYSDDISAIAASFKDKIILSEVKNAYNYKNIKQELGEIGSTLYNGASDELQNYSAQYVYKKTYSNIASLKSAVEYAINNPPSSGTSGGGGGGSSKPVIQTGSISSGTSVTPENNTIPNSSQSPFSDLSKSHWAYDYIIYMNQSGIMTGYDGKCRPEDSITRAEFAKIICTAFNVPSGSTVQFDDVKSDDWFAPYVSGANSAGIVLGSGSHFNPNTGITREDAAVILWRTLQKNGFKKTDAANTFKDSDFNSYAVESVSELSALGIINGIKSDTFAPKQYITRSQAAKLLYYTINIGGDK